MLRAKAVVGLIHDHILKTEDDAYLRNFDMVAADAMEAIGKLVSTVPPMPAEVAVAIAEVCRGVRKLHKTDSNSFQKYNYASADTFFEVIGPMMAEAGLFILSQQTGWQTREVPTERGGNRVLLFIDFDLYLAHQSGAVWQAPIRRTVNVDAGGPQSWGAADTYVQKQFMRSLFKVPTGEADADSQQPFKEAPAPRARTTTRRPSPGPVPVYSIGDDEHAPIEPDFVEPDAKFSATDPVGGFLQALTDTKTTTEANELLRTFREGPGKNISKADQQRCADAHKHILTKLERFKQ